MVALADLHHLFARGAELLDGVNAVVGSQQRVVGSAVVQAMSPVAEMPFAEGPDEVAVPIENHDGMLSPSQHKYPILGVHRHTGTFQQLEALRQFGPVLDEGVSKVALSVNICHLVVLSPHLRVRLTPHGGLPAALPVYYWLA